MVRLAAALVLALGLTGCGAYNTVSEGFQHAHAVESDLEASTGTRPQVGFNWTNGRLAQVTVMYPRIDDTKPLRVIAAAARAAIIKEFQQTPENIVLAFTVGG